MSKREHDDSGFEALLRPIQDVLTKNWEITLTKYLERYLSHLRVGQEPTMNFSEAALLLQNSAHFYCRRVDLVFDFMNKLTNALQKKDSDDEGGGPSRKKKVTKVLQSEELLLLDLVFTDDNINYNFNKKLKHPLKTIVLNTALKISLEPNSSCPIYQLNGTELGFKEEFRLHWRISSNGSLREDFNSTSENDLVQCTRTLDMTVEEESEVERFGDGEDNDMDPLAEPVSSPCPPSPIMPLPSPMPPERCSDQPDTRKKSKAPSKNEDLWAPCVFNFDMNFIKYQKRTTFKLPKAIISSVKRRKMETKDSASDSLPDTYFPWQSIVKKSSPFAALEFKLEVDKKASKAVISKRQFANYLAVRRAAQEFNEDLAGFYSDNEDDEGFAGFNTEGHDSDVGDNDGGMEMSLDLGDMHLPISAREERDEGAINKSFERDTALTLRHYEEAKRETMNSDIAKRVAAWHESIQPVLAAAEKRSTYDVHEYGSRILEQFPSTSTSEEPPVRSFMDVCRGQPKEEICRYFLSSLMLANTYNVELKKTDEGDLAKDCLELKLLSRVRHHEELDDNLRSAASSAGH